MDKEQILVKDLDPKHLPLNQNWSWDRILRSNFIKQADVLQGLYTFGDRFTLEQKTRKLGLLRARTVQESSLSPWSCIRLSLQKSAMRIKAVELYQRSARLDLDNYNNDTEAGFTSRRWSGHGCQSFTDLQECASQTMNFLQPDDSRKTGTAIRSTCSGVGHHLTIDSTRDNVTIKQTGGTDVTLSLYGNAVTVPANESITIETVKRDQSHERNKSAAAGLFLHSSTSIKAKICYMHGLNLCYLDS